MSEPRRAEPATAVGAAARETDVGSVFVSNYPPYSFWSEAQMEHAHAALAAPPRQGVPFGLYLHVPFCRKRCKFCYFKVYTDKNAREVERYLDALVAEARALAEQPAVAGRPLDFVYFGGGTPSFISAKHLRRLVDALGELFPWRAAREVTFECEPGTLTRSKLETLREIGITRLSLGVENFDDAILEDNGRAHVSEEIYRVLPWIAELDFDQLNVDLIAGMVGERWESWRETVRKTIEVEPDSVTIYQMELPYNTEYSRRVLGGDALPVADWPTKRAWHDYAIDALAAAGYAVSSAYTMVKGDAEFVYRDALWHGADMLGIGVSSFSHVGGVHFQNASSWQPYLTHVEAGRSPIERAYRTTAAERLTRELILQLKLGVIDARSFADKFGVAVLERYADVFARLAERGVLRLEPPFVRLTRAGLLRVDQLLPEFYAAEHQNARYT